MLTLEQQQQNLCTIDSWIVWVHFHVDFFFDSKLTVINNFQLVDSMIAELRIQKANYKLHADFQLGQRVSAPIPCIVEGSTLLKS